VVLELSAWIPDVVDDVIDAVSPERVIVFARSRADIGASSVMALSLQS